MAKKMIANAVNGTIDAGVPSLHSAQRSEPTYSTIWVATMAFPSKAQKRAMMTPTWTEERTTLTTDAEVSL